MVAKGQWSDYEKGKKKEPKEALKEFDERALTLKAILMLSALQEGRGAISGEFTRLLLEGKFQ